MALPRPIASTQTDAKSPIDDNLMDSIRINLDYLDSQIVGGDSFFFFNVNGDLSVARSLKGKALDTAVNFGEFTPTLCRAVLKESGTSGNIAFDIRKATSPKTPIQSIVAQYEGNTQSIARLISAVATQSIQRSQAQINIQAINFFKDQLNIQSIIRLGASKVQYNFNGALLDADYKVGAYILFAGCTNAANDGNFQILEVNRGNNPSVVIFNASAVDQATAAGNANLKLMEYVFTNPASGDYVAGELVLFASTTAGANSGQFVIHKVNALGNNIVCYVQNGVVQVGAAGTSDVNRWIFALTGAASATAFVIGETVFTSSHSSGGNNGQLEIVDINRAGNNLIIYNPSGVLQGSPAGNIDTNRILYAMNTDPSDQVEIGDKIEMKSHSNANNNGVFEVVLVNQFASNNIVILNSAFVAQAGVAGQARHTKKLIKFVDDQSAVYSASSFIEIEGSTKSDYNHAPFLSQYKVLQVNRGGGANYNVVIDGDRADDQLSPSGFIAVECKSIFLSPVIETITTVGTNDAEKVTKLQSSNMVGGTVAANETLLLYLTEIPDGFPKDLTVLLK